MIGDGLMAIFGAPLPLDDHAGAAVRAALDMIEMIELLNVERTAAGKAALRIGIGIATGEMVAGYTGTQQRATYTCIGDTVNLAARLESHTKVAQRDILIDDATGGLDPAVRSTRWAVAFKGKAASVEVHAVVVGKASHPAYAAPQAALRPRIASDAIALTHRPARHAASQGRRRADRDELRRPLSAQSFPPSLCAGRAVPGRRSDRHRRAALAQMLGDALGQQVVVDNRGGAGGRSAPTRSQSPADGYALLMARSARMRSIRRSTRAAVRREQGLHAARPDSLRRSRSWSIRARPTTRRRADRRGEARAGRINFGSAGNGTPGH